MTKIDTKNEFDDNILAEAKQLTHRIAAIYPCFILYLRVDWSLKFKIPINGIHGTTLRHVVMDYKAYIGRTFLIHEWKHYILINTLARYLLCKGTDNLELLDFFPKESFRERITNNAYMMIWEMHQKWMDKEDLSLFIPPTLLPYKEDFIESYLKMIRVLNLKDETEGTLAYLLHDYCRTMLIYDCIFQIADGVNLERLNRVYGDYAAKASSLYHAMVSNLGVGDSIKII